MLRISSNLFVLGSLGLPQCITSNPACSPKTSSLYVSVVCVYVCTLTYSRDLFDSHHSDLGLAWAVKVKTWDLHVRLTSTSGFSHLDDLEAWVIGPAEFLWTLSSRELISSLLSSCVTFHARLIKHNVGSFNLIKNISCSLCMESKLHHLQVQTSFYLYTVFSFNLFFIDNHYACIHVRLANSCMAARSI